MLALTRTECITVMDKHTKGCSFQFGQKLNVVNETEKNITCLIVVKIDTKRLIVESFIVNAKMSVTLWPLYCTEVAFKN